MLYDLDGQQSLNDMDVKNDQACMRVSQLTIKGTSKSANVLILMRVYNNMCVYVITCYMFEFDFDIGKFNTISFVDNQSYLYLYAMQVGSARTRTRTLLLYLSLTVSSFTPHTIIPFTNNLHPLLIWPISSFRCLCYLLDTISSWFCLSTCPNHFDLFSSISSTMSSLFFFYFLLYIHSQSYSTQSHHIDFNTPQNFLSLI